MEASRQFPSSWDCGKDKTDVRGRTCGFIVDSVLEGPRGRRSGPFDSAPAQNQKDRVSAGFTSAMSSSLSLFHHARCGRDVSANFGLRDAGSWGLIGADRGRDHLSGENNTLNNRERPPSRLGGREGCRSDFRQRPRMCCSAAEIERTDVRADRSAWQMRGLRFRRATDVSSAP